jgi:hypothetical protein
MLSSLWYKLRSTCVIHALWALTATEVLDLLQKRQLAGYFQLPSKKCNAGL